MAKTRKFCAYRRMDGKPYTRTSKYRAKSYIRMTKNPRIVRWHMGDVKKKFNYVYRLYSRQSIQIRDIALESARLTMNGLLEKGLGKESFHLFLRVYPHHVLRENALASGAGADRLSQGMSQAFGKAVGIAARIREGQIVAEIYVDKNGLDAGKKAMIRARTKLPGTYELILEKVEGKSVKPSTPVIKKPAKKSVEPVEKKTAEKPAPKLAEKPIEKPAELAEPIAPLENAS